MESRKFSNILLLVLVLNLTIISICLAINIAQTQAEVDNFKKEVAEIKDSFQKIATNVEASTTILNRRSEKVVRYLDALDKLADRKLILQRKSGKYEITIEDSELVPNE